MNGIPAFSQPFNQGSNQENFNHNNNHHGQNQHGNNNQGNHGHNNQGHHNHHHQQQQQQTYFVEDFTAPGMHVTVTSSSPSCNQPIYQQPQNFHQNGHHQQQQQAFGMMNFTSSSNQSHQSNGNSYFNQNLPHMVKRSQKIGRDHHHGSQHFDQFFTSNLKNEFHTPEADSITVYHTHNIVVGIEVHYKSTGNNNVATLCNRGSHSGHIQTSNIKLNFGEHFTEISGRAGDSIDRICIKTSGGRCLEVGGNGGNTFGNILPWGHPRIVGFGGSTREFLDSFYVLHN